MFANIAERLVIDCKPGNGRLTKKDTIRRWLFVFLVAPNQRIPVPADSELELMAPQHHLGVRLDENPIKFGTQKRIRYGPGGPVLMSGDLEIPLSNVVEVLRKVG